MRTRAVTVVLLALVGAAMYVAIRAHRDLTDFQVYRTAAARAAAAEPLYRADDGHYQFKYLPAFAVLTRPLVWLDESGAKVVWFAMSFALVAMLLQTLLVRLPDRRLPLAVLGVLAGVVLAKFFVRELALGQTNALLGVLMLPAITAGRRQPILAGAGVGVAIFVKPYAALLLPWLAVALPLSATLAAAVAIAGGLALPMLAYGWTGNLLLLRAWWQTVMDTTGPNLLHPDNISMASVWAKWIGASALSSGLAVTTSAVLLVVASLVVLRGRKGASAHYLDAGLLLLLVPLISPQGWDYVLLLGTPVVIVAIDRWRELSRGWRIACIAVAIVFATPLRLMVSVDAYNAVMATGLVTVAALTLVAVAATLRRRGLA